MKSVPTSRLSRGIGASTVIFGLAGRTVASRARRLFSKSSGRDDAAVRDGVASAEAIVARLGALKGLLMKVGQIASFMSPSLPDGVRRALAQLQTMTEPMPPEVAAQVVTAELGQSPDKLFAEWSPQPFAAASIGQVHRARHRDGRELAVKVQYPGVEKAIQSDLRNAAVMNAFGGLLFRGLDYDAMMDEMRVRLLEECDYLHEAQSQESFGRAWQGQESVIIPGVVSELTSRRVLTSDLIGGQDFDAFVSTASAERRNHAGDIMMRFAYESILAHNMFNCDPHPGNYRFVDGKVAFLDFGSVKHFEPGMVDLWRQMLVAVARADMPSFRRIVIGLGIATEGRKFDFDAQFRIAEYLSRPWLRDEVFRFSADYLRGTFPLMIFDNPNKFTMNLPPDLLFLNRLQWGLYAV
jgi:predicted unusual protein kinase regulating ubiquinone biosynthesis (AarF/ABC1/UbiB family)